MLYIHKGHSYAIGLAWSDFVDAAEARAHVRKARRPSVVVDVTGQGTGQHAVAVGLCEDMVLPGPVISGAMAVGLVFPNTLISQALADGRVWFASVASGVPFSGHDRIVAPAEAAPLLREQMSYVHDIVGDARGARMSLADALDIYEGQVADGRISRAQVRAARIQPPASLARRGAALAAVAMAVAGIAAVVWMDALHLRSAADRRAALARLTQSREQAARQEADRRAAIQAFREAVEERRAGMLGMQQGPRPQWEAWERVRRQLPLTVNGYVADSMQCTPARCIVDWKAGGPHVRFVDRSAIPDRIDGDAPVTSARSQVDLQSLPPGSAMPQGPSAPALRLAVAQALQYQVRDASVGEAGDIVLNPPAGLGLQPVTLGAGGTLRFVVDGPAALVQAGDAMRMLQPLPVSLESLRWNQLAASPSLELEGRWTFVNP